MKLRYENLGKALGLITTGQGQCDWRVVSEGKKIPDEFRDIDKSRSRGLGPYGLCGGNEQTIKEF